MTKGDDCTTGATHTADIKALQDRVDRHDDDEVRMWEAIDKLRNRLPLWATITLGALASTATGLIVAMAKM